MDQVFADVANPKVIEPTPDLPGMGMNYCRECARHFIDQASLDTHRTTKLHKKRVKVLKTEKPYTQKEADAAAGLM
jgi:bud site selection protein 20